MRCAWKMSSTGSYALVPLHQPNFIDKQRTNLKGQNRIVGFIFNNTRQMKNVFKTMLQRFGTFLCEVAPISHM